MDAHTDFHFTNRQLEGGLAIGGQSNGTQCDTHGAGVLGCLLGGSNNSVKIVASICCCACDLVKEEDAGNTAAARFLTRGSGRDIVSTENRLDSNALSGRQVSSKIKVQDVAAVVAIEVKNASATINALGDLEHRVGRGALEDVTNGNTIKHSFTHISEEQRKVSRTATGSDGDFALHRSVLTNKSVVVSAHRIKGLGVREQNTVEHFGDEFDRTVQNLLHRDSFVK